MSPSFRKIVVKSLDLSLRSSLLNYSLFLSYLFVFENKINFLDFTTHFLTRVSNMTAKENDVEKVLLGRTCRERDWITTASFQAIQDGLEGELFAGENR